MIVALHSILIDGQEAAYEHAHAAVGDDLIASLRGVGIRDWTIWRSGRDLFHVVDCDDFASAMTALGDDPVNQRWQEHMATYVDHIVTTGQGTDQIVLRTVWSLATQLGDEQLTSQQQRK